MNRRLMPMCQWTLWVPCALGLIAVWAVVAIERMGAGDAIGVVPRNSAEAAGMASAGEVLRFLRLGDDPNTVYPVHPRIISSAVRYATTLEAAVLARQVELVELLDRQGAIIDAEQRHRLACLAADLQSDVVVYLAPNGPEGCEPDAEYERVLDRTRDAAPE